MSNKTRVAGIVLLLGLALSGGCGKKGSPVPQDSKKLFAWKAAEATIGANDCLNVAAILTGATENADSFVLELEPESEDICVDCPFTPSEFVEVTPQKAVPRDQGMQYVFSYCPQSPAPSYRWRLVAKNVFRAFPYVLTPVHTLKAGPDQAVTP